MARGISTVAVRRAAALAIAAAAATALSACGAGQVTQTDAKQAAIAGVNVDQGDLALRDLQIEFDSAEGYESGGDAPLRLWIANEGTETVHLDGILTEAGTVTFVSADAEEPTEAPAEEETTSEAAEGEAAEDSEEATDEASATETPSESPAPEEPAFDGEPNYEPIEIAPGDFVRFDMASGGDYFLIEDLAQDLGSGAYITVNFVFSNGENVTAEIPVGQAFDQDEPSYYEPTAEVEHH